MLEDIHLDHNNFEALPLIAFGEQLIEVTGRKENTDQTWPGSHGFPLLSLSSLPSLWLKGVLIKVLHLAVFKFFLTAEKDHLHLHNVRQRAGVVVPQLHTSNFVLKFALIVAKSVCVFHRVHMDTKTNVHATGT